VALMFGSAVVVGCNDESGVVGPNVPATQPSAFAAGDNRVGQGRPGDIIPDEYIVVFRDDATDVPSLAKQMAAQNGASLRFTYTAALRGFAAHMSAHAAQAIQRNPRVAQVEPDRVVTLDATQQYPPSWGLDRIDQRSRPYDHTYNYMATGAGVNLYIIDSGIRASHSEFGGRVTSAFSAISDGRGTGDCNGHGTHVAGTVGGRTMGVAKGVQLHAVRVIDCSGSGSASGAIAGIDWVTKNRVLPAVANTSLAAIGSSSLNTAVQNSINAGVVYTASAGNSATDACNQSPANLPAAVTVAASSAGDLQAGFSNYGRCVDVYAPGVGISSAWFTSDTATFSLNGTSMAAPHVAGVAALYLETNPGATPAAVTQAILDNATQGHMGSLGTGSPNRLLYSRFDGATMAPTPTPAPAPTPVPVVDQPPTAAFTTSCPKAACTFDASASSDDKGVVTYTWSFGDGSSTASANGGARMSYVYQAKGSYVVTLVVTDSSGQAAETRRTVTIKRL
jgi:subtilisin family serine protease